MKRLIAALGLLALTTAAAAAEDRLGVVERNQTTFSPALGRALVYNVYRPDADPSDGRRWPVIYLLEGRPSESDWLDQGFVFELIDEAVRSGVIPPTLVVMPVAPFSWYVDNADPGGAGMVATALTEDLVAAVDARYPTAACRGARAVGGLSMGGYGALLFSLLRPDRYRAAMSFSGAIAVPLAERDVARLARADAFYDGAFGQPLDRERFNAWTVFSQLKAAQPEAPKADVFLGGGDRDRLGLLQTAVRLHGDLLRSGHDSTLRIGAGQHDWDTWRAQLREALTWLGPRLDPDCGRAVAETPTVQSGAGAASAGRASP